MPIYKNKGIFEFAKKWLIVFNNRYKYLLTTESYSKNRDGIIQKNLFDFYEKSTNECITKYKIIAVILVN